METKFPYECTEITETDMMREIPQTYKDLSIVDLNSLSLYKTTGLGRHSNGTEYQTMFFATTFLIFIAAS